MWIVLSLVSAFCESAKDAFGKKSSIKTNEYHAAMWLHMFSLLILIPVVILTGIPTLKTIFWWGSAAFIILTPLWSILYMKALRMSPLSVTLPMMAFNPIFTGLLSFLFKGQPITVNGWVGIIFIASGMYYSNIKTKITFSTFFHPFIEMFKDKGAQAMLGVAFIWSLGAYFSKMRVDGSSATFSTFSGAIIGVATTYIILKIKKESVQLDKIFENIRVNFPVGMFYFLATLISGFALVTGSAAYVFAIKRSSFIFSSAIGKYIFHEHINRLKYLGLFLTLLGIVFISL